MSPGRAANAQLTPRWQVLSALSAPGGEGAVPENAFAPDPGASARETHPELQELRNEFEA